MGCTASTTYWPHDALEVGAHDDRLRTAASAQPRLQLGLQPNTRICWCHLRHASVKLVNTMVGSKQLWLTLRCCSPSNTKCPQPSGSVIIGLCFYLSCTTLCAVSRTNGGTELSVSPRLTALPPASSVLPRLLTRHPHRRSCTFFQFPKHGPFRARSACFGSRLAQLCRGKQSQLLLPRRHRSQHHHRTCSRPLWMFCLHVLLVCSLFCSALGLPRSCSLSVPVLRDLAFIGPGVREELPRHHGAHHGGGKG